MKALTHKFMKENGFIDGGFEKGGKIYVSLSDCHTGYVLATVHAGEIVDCAPMIYSFALIEQLIASSEQTIGQKVNASIDGAVWTFQRTKTDVLYYKFNPLLQNEDQNVVTSISNSRVQALSVAKKKLITNKKMA
jgi:hypothetical protein